MHPKLSHPIIQEQIDFTCNIDLVSRMTEEYGTVIVKMLFGSRVYGTALPSSDTDFKGIFLPIGRDIVLGRAPSTQNIHTNDPNSGTKNTADDIDIELFSIYRYLELLSQGQTVSLDILFAPEHNIIQKTTIWDYITSHKQFFLNKKCKAAIGYAQAQASKYSLRGYRMLALEHVLGELESEFKDHPHRPLENSAALRDITAGLKTLDPQIAQYITFTKEIAPHIPAGHIEYLYVCGKKAGFTASVKFAYEMFQNTLGGYGDRAKAAKEGGADWKAMYHAVRITEQTVELLDTGHITFPRPEAPYLLQVRRGERSVAEVSTRIEEGIYRITEAQARSTLPERTDWKAVEELMYKMYLEEIIYDARKRGMTI